MPNSREMEKRTIKAFYDLKKRYQISECFNKNDRCSPTIIEAHSIQKNRILKGISENGHVLMFQSLPDIGKLKWEPVLEGINTATIFTGFCDYHDVELFRPIDTLNYEIENEEQEFLFAYRAVAKEHNIKLSMHKLYVEIMDWINGNNYEKLKKYHLVKNENEMRILKTNIPFLQSMVTELKAACRDLDKLKLILNRNLESQKYSNVITKVLSFNEAYPLACSACISLSHDFEGNRVNNLRILNTSVNDIFLTIFSQNNHTYVLISFMRKQKHYFRFVDNIVAKNLEDQKILITNLLLKHVENFAISPSYWNRFDNDFKDKVTRLFEENISPLHIKLNRIEDLNIFSWK